MATTSGVPDGMYFGGGESEEEDGGFVFGDSPPTARSYIAEPTLSAVTKKVAARGNEENGRLSSSEEEDQRNGMKGYANGKTRIPPRAGHPPRPGMHTSVPGRWSRRRKGWRSRGDVGGRGRLTEEGEMVKVMVTHGNIEELQKTLDGGFDPNTPLKSGWSALMYACDCGDDVIVELLLSHGANPNTQKDMFTALMAVCSSRADKEEPLAKCARMLINKGARVNSHDRHHMSPLLYACQNGRVSLTQLLVSVNGDVNKQDSRGWTPLFYAAKTGNYRLAQALLDAGADPETLCNMGETAGIIANAQGFTNLADLLDGRLGQAPAGLSHLSVAEGEGRPEGAGTGASGSSSAPVRYGDLELFLLGLQLGHLLPLFKSHQVKFADLLSMTDRDLQQMGVSQVGCRKKILDAILQVHRKEWDMPKEALPHNRSFSPSEAAVILAHLTKHSSYIKGTASFLLTHAQTNPDLLDPNMEPLDAEALSCQAEDAAAAVAELQTEVATLQTLIHSALGESSRKTANRETRTSWRKLRRVVGVVAVVGVAAVVGGGLVFGGRALINRLRT